MNNSKITENGKTGIIVVHWSNPHDTIRCISSLLHLNYQNFEIILVNNGSDQINPIKTSFPDLLIHSLEVNSGFTGGYNYGMKIAMEKGCDYLWLVNNDLIVDSNTLTILINKFRELPDAAFLGPVILTIEKPDVILSAGGSINGRVSYHHHIGNKVNEAFLTLHQVDYISGCAILTHASVVRKIGFLYEPFFAYHEDIEWCYRAKLAGLKTYIVPEAHVWHPDTRLRDEDRSLITYYINRNSLYFIARYFGIKDVLLQFADNIRTIISWTIRPRWKNKRNQRDALIHAMIDFIFNRYGRYTQGNF